MIKKKRTTYHIFTPNTQKTSNWTWKQKHSTLYKCSLQVLCNLGFKSSITKSNKTRVLALINNMTTSLLPTRMKTGHKRHTESLL